MKVHFDADIRMAILEQRQKEREAKEYRAQAAIENAQHDLAQRATELFNVAHVKADAATNDDRVANVNAKPSESIPEANQTTDDLSWPKVWHLFGFLLPHSIRDRVYGPAVQELLLDHLEARRYRSTWARRWLCFCFLMRTALLAINCIRATGLDKLAYLILKLMPEPLRRWWTS